MDRGGWKSGKKMNLGVLGRKENRKDNHFSHIHKNKSSQIGKIRGEKMGEVSFVAYLQDCPSNLDFTFSILIYEGYNGKKNMIFFFFLFIFQLY